MKKGAERRLLFFVRSRSSAAERLLDMQEVPGSIPGGFTKRERSSMAERPALNRRVDGFKSLRSHFLTKEAMMGVSAETMGKFFRDMSETGRFVVVSSRTGRRYFVEPITGAKTEWGSLNPATGKLMHKKGDGKYTGSVKEKDSLISEENGFKNVKTLEPGLSPLKYIEFIDDGYPPSEAAD